VPRAAAQIEPSGKEADWILRVEDVEREFGGVRALDGATLAVQRGSVTALIGPNGAGKTTLFNVITGFSHTPRGTVHYAGRSISRCAPHVIARRGLVRTFQLTKTLAGMSVTDNMLLAAGRQPGERCCGLLAGGRASRRREREAREMARGLLATFDLTRHAEAYAGTLSGGQRKLLELARALMLEPAVVLLDEPMAGVNPVLGERLLGHIQELRARRGTTFFFIEHDMDVVARHSDRVIVMANGKVIANGLPDEISRDRRVLDAYLGGDEQP